MSLPSPSDVEVDRTVATPSGMTARSAGMAAAVPGLSMAHKRPSEYQWKLSVNPEGSLCELKRIGEGIQLARPSAKRGRIKGFSRGSRSRLLKAIGRLKQNELPVFVTLTYPDDFPVSPERWQRDLAALWRRIRRQWPEAAAIWKKEFKRRKSGVNVGKVAPHYHMLLWLPEWLANQLEDWIRHWKLQFARADVADGKILLRSGCYAQGVEFTIEDLGPNVEVVRRQYTNKKGTFEVVEHWEIDGINHLTQAAIMASQGRAGQVIDPKDALQAWFAVNWYEVVGSEEPKHMAAGTGVEVVRSMRGVLAYASKYLAKIDDDPATEYESIGRCWGIMGRQHLPWSIVEQLTLSNEQGIRLRRAAVRYLKAGRKKKRSKNRAPGLWWLSDSPVVWMKCLDFIKVTMSADAQEAPF
jgi:hypothetical protein